MMRWPKDIEVILPESFPDAPERDPRRDFGGVVRGAPIAVLRPADVDGLARTLRFLAEEKQPYRLRGAGFGAGGQVVADGGVVVDLTRLDRIIDVGAGEITVEGGATWLAVGDRLREIGRRPLILAENLAMTVGGTLAVGGLGDTSAVHGPTVSQVLRLTLVTPDGQIRKLGPGDKLFRFALGAAGTLGAIAEVTLRTVARPATLVSRTLAWVNIDEFAAEAPACSEQRLYEFFQGTLSWTPDGATRVHVVAGNFAAAATPGEPGLWELKPNGVGAPETADRYASLRALRVGWDLYRPALQLIAPTAFAGEVLKQLNQMILAEPGLRASLPRVGLLPFTTDERFPVATQPASPVALAILLRPQVAERGSIDELLPLLRTIASRALDGGVKIGLTSIDLGLPDFAERQLGPVLGELRGVRAEIDPLGLCNRGVIAGLDHDG